MFQGLFGFWLQLRWVTQTFFMFLYDSMNRLDIHNFSSVLIIYVCIVQPKRSTKPRKKCAPNGTERYPVIHLAKCQKLQTQLACMLIHATTKDTSPSMPRYQLANDEEADEAGQPDPKKKKPQLS